MDSSKIILLIEDDDVDAMTVKRILKTLGITNKLAHKIDGEEGVDYLTDQANEKPALIMLDLNMPRMNGREFIQDMRKIRTPPKFRLSPFPLPTQMEIS